MRRRASPRLVTSLLFVFLSSLTAIAQETSWDQRMGAGREALEARRYVESERHFKAALGEAEGFASSDHRLITSLETLAELYHQQGMTAPQEPLKKRILEIREGELGATHPDLVPDLLGLAWLYEQREKPAEALPLVKRVLEIRETALGPNDAQTIESVNELGRTLLELQRFTEAEEMFRRSLLTHESASETNPRALAHDLQNLSAVYSSQGKREDAEAFSRQALEIQSQELGKLSAFASDASWKLGKFYWAHRRFAEAEPLLLNHLEVEEKRAGPDRGNLLFLYAQMARFYHMQGRDEEAEKFTQRAHGIATRVAQEKPTDPTDRHAAMRIHNSGNLFMREGRYAEAEQLYRRELEIDRKAGRPEYPSLSSDLESLGMALCAQGNLGRAVPLFRQATQITEKAQGSDHPSVAGSLLHLARCYSRVESYAEAEAVLKRAIQILDKPRPQIPFEIFNVLEFYARLLRATDREAEAKRVDARMQELNEKLRQPNPEP